MSVAAPSTAIDLLAINTIRTLSMDAVQKANSGHPGTPMALAPLAYQIWQHNLRYDPSQPLWPGRDRFVLSCGHASMLLYSVLHLAGVRKVAKHDNELEEGLAITLEDIKNFRQLHSPCAGHPEFGEARLPVTLARRLLEQAIAVYNSAAMLPNCGTREPPQRSNNKTAGET